MSMRTARGDHITRPRVPFWVGDIALGLLLILTACTPEDHEKLQFLWSPGRALPLIIMAVVLPFRRKYPRPTLGVVVFLSLVAIVVPSLTSGYSRLPSLGYQIAVAVVIFQVALTSSRRQTIIISSFTIGLLGIAVAAALGLVPSLIVGGTAVIGFAAAAGNGVRNRRAYIDAITERAERAERTRDLEAQRRVTDERLRIARELHDAAAHQIAAINLHAGVASKVLTDRPEEAERALAVIRESASSVLKEISTLLGLLRSGDDQIRTEPRPVLGVAGIGDMIEMFERLGLRVAFESRGTERPLSGSVDVVAYRVVQEALTNAHKHGSRHEVSLSLIYEAEEFTIVSVNPIDPSRVAQVENPSGRHGLLGMRERLELVGGTLVSSDSNGSYALRASIPLPASVKGKQI